MSPYTADHARSHGERPTLDVWPNQFPEGDTEIEIILPEFTCHCPKTGQPDFATLRIVYVPDGHCLELKSLKTYSQAYREMGVFHENVVNLFHQDLSAALKPRRLLVEGRFNARGGIATTVRRGSAGA